MRNVLARGFHSLVNTVATDGFSEVRRLCLCLREGTKELGKSARWSAALSLLSVLLPLHPAPSIWQMLEKHW